MSSITPDARWQERLCLEKFALHAPFAMLFIDADGNFKFANPRFQELFGYDLESVPNGREWFRLAFPDSALRHEAIAAWLDEVSDLATGEKRSRSFKVACRDGTNKIIRFVLVMLEDRECILTCEDISERRADTGDLRIAQQQLWDIIEFLPDATFVIDKDKRVIAWNRAIEEMTGILKQDIIGRGDYAYSIPFYGIPRPILIDLIFMKNEEIESRYNFFERRGDTLYAETIATCLPARKDAFLWAKATPLLDNEGNVVGAIESIRDITERRQSEEAIEEVNLKLQALIRASPLAILTFDQEGIIQSWNAAAERIFGWKEEEALGRHPPFVPEDKMHEFRALIGIALQGKTYTGFELQRVRKDGSPIVISLSSAPITDAKGRVQGIVSVMDDITKKKSAERSLRENFHFLQRLMDTIPNPIFYKNNDGRFLGCNLAFENFVGHYREDIIGGTVYDIYPKDQADFCASSDAALFRDSGIRIEETTMHLGDGRRVDVISNKATYTNEKGILAGLVEVIIDITERKTSEEELRKAKDAAEEAARVKAEFLANMSHEIRTPLNAVIGMTGLLLDANLSPENRDYVETIRSSGDALLAIINDILDFSKIDGGKMELERQPFDLSGCIEESFDLVAANAAEKGLNLAYQIDDQTPDLILGDLTRLRQIIVNLLSNAVKFTDAGEVLMTVTSRPIADDYYEIRFSVKDTGIGISGEQMSRLFQSFSQLDATTSRKYGGTGLGLAISKRLVGLMGGRIWVESQPALGSNFMFTIITDVVTASPKSHKISNQPMLAGKRVLIIDEFETNLQIMTGLARFWGMKTKTASSSLDALDLTKCQAFDVAIVGTSLKDMDLATLVCELKGHQRNLPVIVCSTLGKKSEDCSQFAAFLSKPIKSAQLYEIFQDIFDENSAHSSQLLNLQTYVRHPLRILLAEDNVVNQKVALKMLKKIGYRADLAANGLEVLEALERLPYDVILMDVQMPEMDGLEATRRIRQRWPSAGLKIVAITAYAMEGDRERCLHAGMDDYISKPVRLHDLVRVLDSFRA